MLDMKSAGFRTALETRLGAPGLESHEAIIAIRNLAEIDEDCARRHAGRLARGPLSEGDGALWFATALRGLGLGREADSAIESAATKTDDLHVRVTAARLLRGAGRGDVALPILEKCAADIEESLNTPLRRSPAENWLLVSRLNGIANEIAANGRLVMLHRKAGEYGAFEVHELVSQIRGERTYFQGRALLAMTSIVSTLDSRGIPCESLKDRIASSAVSLRSHPAVTPQSLRHAGDALTAIGNEADAVECYIDAYKLSVEDADRKLCEKTLRDIGYDKIANSLARMSARSIT